MSIEDIWKFDLRKGNTDHPRNGACLYDAAKWIAYGVVGDNPSCACPVIRAYAISINDTLPDDQRQRLKVFIPRVIGNRDPEHEQARAEYLAWEAIRVFAPLALDAAGFDDHAERLRSIEGDLAAAEIAAKYAANVVPRSTAKTAEAAARYAAWAASGIAAAVNYAPGSGLLASVGRDAAWAALEAARAAKAANRAFVYDAMIKTLDGVLKIGKQAEEFDIAHVHEAVRRFEEAARA